VLPTTLPAQRPRLAFAQRLETGALKIAVEPHALLGRRRAQLHELTEHALVGFSPEGHRFDRLSRQLRVELLGLRHVRHVRLLPGTVLRTSISRPRITRRVSGRKRYLLRRVNR